MRAQARNFPQLTHLTVLVCHSPSLEIPVQLDLVQQLQRVAAQFEWPVRALCTRGQLAFDVATS